MKIYNNSLSGEFLLFWNYSFKKHKGSKWLCLMQESIIYKERPLLFKIYLIIFLGASSNTTPSVVHQVSKITHSRKIVRSFYSFYPIAINPNIKSVNKLHWRQIIRNKTFIVWEFVNRSLYQTYQNHRNSGVQRLLWVVWAGEMYSGAFEKQLSSLI